MKKTKSLTSTAIIILFLIILTVSKFNISFVDAQSIVEEIDGFGDSLERFTCADGQRPPTGPMPNEIINFNAIESVAGTTGEFIIAGVDTGLAKEGEINTIDISGDQFTISGTETSDTLCQDEVPSEITISGDCEINDRFPVAEMRFEAENGEQGTFTGGVKCIDNDNPIEEQFKNQGQCIKFANNNPGSEITKEICKMIFQNKFNGQ
jgi:hypothetical protein